MSLLLKLTKARNFCFFIVSCSLSSATTMPKKNNEAQESGSDSDVNLSMENIFGSKSPSNKIDDLKVVVFDLDYTLWPFWVDTHVTPPFTLKNGKVVDRYGATIKYYPEVPEVLSTLHAHGYELAVASRTGEIKGARQLLQLFNWDKFFKYKEIFPGCKVTHFSNIKKAAGCDYKEMIFFDDEHRNIYDINGLGVTSVLVENGDKAYHEKLRVLVTFHIFEISAGFEGSIRLGWIHTDT